MYKEFPGWEANGWVRLWFKETGGMVNPPETGNPCSYGCADDGNWRFFCCLRDCSSGADGDVDLRLLPRKSNTGWASPCWLVAGRAEDTEGAMQGTPPRCSAPRAALGALSVRAAWPCGAAVLGELWRDSRAAAASAYCCSSLMISGLSGEMGRVSSSALGSCGDEALCLPLLVDSREELWEPANKETGQVRSMTSEKT